MNETTDKPRDQALSRLYSQAGPAEPPAALDTAILARARQVVTSTPVAAPWWRRLRAPLAVAATITLAVGLSLTVDRQPPQRADAPASAARTNEAPPPPPPAQAEAKLEQTQPQPEQAAPRAKVLRDAAPLAKQAQPSGTISAPRPEVAPSPALTAPAVSPPPAPATAATAPAASAPAALGATAESAAADRAETRRASAAKPVAEARRDAAAHKPAETWLEEIRQLQRQGRNEDARRELDAFRRAYPDFALPHDLRQP